MDAFAAHLIELGTRITRSVSPAECCDLVVSTLSRALVTDRVGIVCTKVLGAVSAGAIPEQDDDEWIGVTVTDPISSEKLATLYVSRDVMEPSDQRLTAAGAQIALAMSTVLRHRDLDRRERQQRALIEAGKTLSSELSLETVLRTLIELATELSGATYGALGVLDESGVELASFITVGMDDVTKARIGDEPRGKGILGVLINDPQPLRLSRIQDHPQSVGFPEHHPPMSSFLGVPIVTTRSVAGRIYLAEKRDGTQFTVEDEALVITLASQAAIAIDNADLYQRLERTAAKLAEASEHKSTFLANVSHELRSPLNTIIGYTRLILDDPRGLDAEQLEDLAIVRGSSEHLLALITDLLDLQRIEAGRVVLMPTSEHLDELLDNVVASARPLAHEGVEIVLDTHDLQNPVIRCDRTRVRQMLLNVLGNALKFTSEGTVTVRASDVTAYVQVDVTDTGPGIPEADLERIFESFFQSSAAMGRTPGPREGAGLGLAITRMLAELHGGDVRLMSSDGEGTTVTLRLPRTVHDESEEPE